MSLLKCLYNERFWCSSGRVFVTQAVDVDVLRAEGLDLDIVDQMKDLAVVGEEGVSQAGKPDDGVSQTGKPDVLAAFDRSAPSTKVLLLLCQYRHFLGRL